MRKVIDIGSYRVRVLTQAAGEQEAVISPARMEDMPNNWTFSWQELWQRTDFEVQNIVKLVYEEQVWGLIRYGVNLYADSPETLEIEHLEANPISRGKLANRLIEPIGKWLIWYATQVSLRYCSGGGSDTPIFLVSLDSAFDYYRDIIEMQYVGAKSIAPGDDGYVFKFSRDNAAAFCRRHERQWGIPASVDS
ncbi:hypothetical protein NDI49_05145 [Trichocoleus sp. ST-U3]|uniref:hypothetical protein n=1 Tax=Coleofasciculus sp. FACHB-542 TaxID=2692787 RepID=UPI001688AEC1|nr:hypothetical protein [Coleofasciculus sp. FACHB-542]MBD2083529.1 hypothetical protein [Coleofasciculus sp. FACHB-542]